jgi:hypothetical protein
MFKKLIFAFTLLIALIGVNVESAGARENVDYWYIKGFQSEIDVNPDSSLTVTEKIIADCGNALDKHGIYRVLPLFYQRAENQKINTPIEILSVTDFNGKIYQYSRSKNYTNKTLTLQIGNPDVTVRGINEYQIEYKVQNAIRFDNQNFDELYWNLSGNFWDLDIDNFQAKIVFPENINLNNQKINLYSGSFGESSNALAKYSINEPNILTVDSQSILTAGEGITVSTTLPKNIFIPYQPGFWERFGNYLFLLLPLLTFLICYLLWNRYGRDPKVAPTIVPEFEIPEKLDPISLGMVYSDGNLKNHFLSAGIIGLAVKGALKIEQIEKGKVFKNIDYKLTFTDEHLDKLTADEKILLSSLKNSDAPVSILNIFSEKKDNDQTIEKNQILLSDLKNNFYRQIPKIKEAVINRLSSKKLIWRHSQTVKIVFLVLGCMIGGGSFPTFAFGNLALSFSILLSGIIIFVFSFLMSRRTETGAQLFKRIQGFKLYMETAEKYRQRFNEKENIFEKFLPYAIVFEMTKLWINKMKDIYGEDYFTSYHPIWYIGMLGNFNVDSFAKEIETMSSSMATTMTSNPSSSGSGGGGFSGGGGGGGGGGGW